MNHPTDHPADRPERQGNPEFVGALSEFIHEIVWENEPETVALDTALRALADVAQVSHSGVTFEPQASKHL